MCVGFFFSLLKNAKKFFDERNYSKFRSIFVLISLLWKAYIDEGEDVFKYLQNSLKHPS